MIDYMIMEAVCLKVNKADQEAAKRAERQNEMREKSKALVKQFG